MEKQTAQTGKEQHTPGPWTFARATADRADDRWAFGPGDTAGIGTVTGIANARLIAAAPALLEALWAIVGSARIRSTHNGRLYSGDFLSVSQDAVDSARAAIGLATNEEQ